MIIYDGPSELDGQRILGIVTGLKGKSTNEKTGPMAQLYILAAGQHPTEALKTGLDSTICGDCKHRPLTGMGSCYVVVAQGPSAVWRAWVRGTYPASTPAEVNAICHAKQKPIRLGAYGDPAALPVGTIRELVRGLRFTGYTHQWNLVRHQALREFCMASVDTPAEYQAAKLLGWRTFRVRLDSEELFTGKEIQCPASDESGYRTTCDKCVLCMGTSIKARDIAIIVHGQHVNKFVSLRRSDGSAISLNASGASGVGQNYLC